MAYSPSQILRTFERLHREIAGADRVVSIAKVTRTAAGPFAKQQTASVDYAEVTPPPIVSDTPDERLWQRIGGAVGPDEKIFTFCATSLVSRDPISTLGERVEALLSSITGPGRGGIRYGSVTYEVRRFFAGETIISVTPQWIVVAKAIK